MKPLDLWPTAARRELAGVFTDIDDTLTTEGAITPDALQACYDRADVFVLPSLHEGYGMALAEALARRSTTWQR